MCKRPVRVRPARGFSTCGHEGDGRQCNRTHDVDGGIPTKLMDKALITPETGQCTLYVYGNAHLVEGGHVRRMYRWTVDGVSKRDAHTAAIAREPGETLTELHAAIRSAKHASMLGNPRTMVLHLLAPERVRHRLVQAWVLAVPLV